MLLFPKNTALTTRQKIEPIVKKIETLNQVIWLTPVQQTIKDKLFYKHVLKSSLFSAKIEGNKLTLVEAKKLNLSSPKQKNQQEIGNVLNTLKKLKTFFGPINQERLKKIHQLVMQKIDCRAGKFRAEDTAIFDQYGTIVYLTPSPQEMQSMLILFFEKFNQLINQKSQSLIQKLILAFQSHYYFEKIHPFVDGNGRVGRVLLHLSLAQIKITPDWILPIDQYLEQHRSTYYAGLNKNTRQVNDFLIFLFEALLWSLEDVIDSIKNLNLTKIETAQKPNILNSLLPRRAEMVYIIKDHPYISLDSVARRFFTIPKRTIAYDIHCLIKQNLIIKHGTTRGVTYSVAKNIF